MVLWSCFYVSNRLRKGGTTVAPRRAVGTCSQFAAPTVPAACPRTRPSRSLSSGTLWRRRQWGTSRRPAFSTVSLPHSLVSFVVSRRTLTFLTWVSAPPRSLRSAQALRQAALLCQLRHPQQGGEEPLLRGQERPNPTSSLQACCEYLYAAGLHTFGLTSNFMSCVVSSRLELQGLPPRPCEAEFEDEHLKNKVDFTEIWLYLSSFTSNLSSYRLSGSFWRCPNVNL